MSGLERFNGRGRLNGMRVRTVLCIGAATMLFAACSPAESDPTVEPPSTTTTTTQSTAAPITAPATTSTLVQRAETRPWFDTRDANEVFAFVDEWEGTIAAGWGSPLLQPFALPDGAEAASPDGRGGVVFTTNDQVWWISDPQASPVVIEQPGIPVELVGLRHVEGEPVVLVRIGDKLIGYDGGEGDLGYVLDQFSGDIVRIDVDRGHVVAIVEGPSGWSVELMVLPTGEVIELLTPVEADREEAPVQVAISGDRVVAVQRSSLATVVSTVGAAIRELDLGFESIPIRSADLVGQNLLIAIGEAAIATNIVTDERSVPDTLEGWVISAMWATAPAAADQPDLSAAMRFRVDTELVEADTADPFLNVRYGPNASHPLLAKLPPTYTGLEHLGPEETAEDGAIWYKVKLLDPVHTTPGEPHEGRAPVGWVNSSYLEPLPEGLPVTLDELPGCVENDYEPLGSGSTPEHVYALESALLSERCLRVVVTFGTGDIPMWWGDPSGPDAGPAAGVPDVWHGSSGTGGSYIDLGDVTSVWSQAVDTEHDVHVVQNGDRLQLWMLSPVRRESLWAFPERGIVVIDYTLDPGVRDAYPREDHIILTREPWETRDGVVAVGIARPFEGQLGARILDSDADLVPAVYSGDLTMGTIETSEYVVMIPDWYPAWRPFVVQAEAVPPGDYTLHLIAGIPSLSIDFTITQRSDAGNPEWMEQFAGPPELATTSEQDIMRTLIAYARGEADQSAVPFADEVTLGLNTVDWRVVERRQLADRRAWDATVEDFDGYSGRFNALDILEGSSFVRITSGPMPHCAGPPLEWPAGFADLRQINIEPIGGDSCLQWFGVGVFLNDSDEIAAVVLDLFGP